MSRFKGSPTALKSAALYLKNAIAEIELSDSMGIDISDMPADRKKANRARLRHAKKQIELVLRDIDPK